MINILYTLEQAKLYYSDALLTLKGNIGSNTLKYLKIINHESNGMLNDIEIILTGE